MTDEEMIEKAEKLLPHPGYPEPEEEELPEEDMTKEISSKVIEAAIAKILLIKGYDESEADRLSYEDIINVPGIGKKKAEAIMAYLKAKSAGSDTSVSSLDYEDVVASDRLMEYFYEFVAENDCSLYYLKPLSIYTVNTFLDNGLDGFFKVARLDEQMIAQFDIKHKMIAAELEKAKRYYFNNHRESVAQFINNLDDKAIINEKKPESEKELGEWIKANHYEEKFKEYLVFADAEITDIGLSNALINSLKSNGINKRSELILADPDAVESFRKMGKGRIEDYRRYRSQFLLDNIDGIIAYCKGKDQTVRYDYYRGKILNYLSDKPAPVQFTDLSAHFTEFSDEELQMYLDTLKKKKKITINRRGIAFALPSFVKVAEKLPEGREKDILMLRLSGKTLEEVGSTYNVTRERARQVEKKAFDKVKSLNKALNNTELFDENRYIYFYENYLMTKDSFMECFDISEKEYYAIQSLSDKKGSKIVDYEILEDEKLESELKTKLQKHLDKDVVKIKGERIRINKFDIRTYVIKKFCRKDSTIDDFMVAYNAFLEKHNLTDRLDLLDEKQARVFENHIGLRMDVLWKQGKKFRYYDIYSRDYSGLLESLVLYRYKNVMISTEKLMKENKKILRKYDICDKDELHNLLRKIYTTPDLYEQYGRYFGEYENNRIDFRKMPSIQFGEFDRDRRLKELLDEMSPIGTKEFAKFLSDEFGYAENVMIANWLGPFSKYIRRKGIYTEYYIETKRMSRDNMDRLEEAIVEPYYTFDDLKKIYADICPDADPEEINSMNLKAMGYLVNDNYIITDGFSSMQDYMDYLIENNTSTADFRKTISARQYYNAIAEKQNSLDIIMYNETDYITAKRLEQMGVSKTDLYRFADEIKALVDDEEYFNYRTVKEKYGYSSILDNLGFDDYFYNKILEFSGGFTWTGAYGTLVFRKDENTDITKASFINYQAKVSAPIELNEFMKNVTEQFGTKKLTKDSVVPLFDESVYYNKILEMIFSDFDSFSEYIAE